MADGRHWKEEYLNEEGKMKNGSPEKEAAYFEELASQIRDVVQHFEEDNNGIKRRANHAKILAGFTNATFRVLPATESTNPVMFGFLSPGKEYKATLRFSNASAEWKKSDRKPDLRGIALRIHTEDGDQDFLMTNAEPHHARDAREAMFAIMAGVEKDVIEDLIPDVFPGEDALAGALGALPYLVKHLGLTGFHIASTLKKQMNIKVESLATETFWSRTPIAIGPDPSPETAVAVKYRLRPAIEKTKDQRLIVAPKKLDVELMNRLTTNEVKYFFEVQFFDDLKTTPVEDSSVSWPTMFHPVAELIIPRGSTDEKEKVDSQSFNPWNVDARFFKPIGNMNRSRKKVYPASVEERQRPG